MKSTSEIKASNKKYLQVFLACSFIVTFYTWIRLIETIPSWILQMDGLEILGGISFVLVIALIETIIILLTIVVLSFILPKRYFAVRLVSCGTLTALCLLLLIVIVQNNLYSILILDKTERLLFFFVVVLLVSMVLVLNNRFKKIDLLINSFVEKAMVLGFVYLILDLFGFGIFIFRNF